MFPWPQGETTSVDRWGAVYFLLGIAFEVFVRRVNDVATFAVDGLALLTAAFVGPALVQIAARLLNTEWSGIAAAALTLLACLIVTLVVGLLFRAFI